MRDYPSLRSVNMFGRYKILVPYDDVDDSNVVLRVNEVLAWHNANLWEEEYLYWYRRGVQPILMRKKEIRPEICNRVVVNNAEQVVTFKNGYFLTDPVSYVAKNDDEETAEKVKKYNELLSSGGKAEADNQTVDWFHTVGVGVEYVEPSDTGVNIYALDPRSACVAYSMRPGNAPVIGIHAVTNGRQVTVDAVTRTKRYILSGMADSEWPRLESPPPLTVTNIVSVEINPVGLVPFVEYQYNSVRQSSFETAIGLMDAINLAESNRLDGVEQAVQQLCVAYNCQFEEGTTANDIRQAGMLVLKSVGDNKADFKILDSVLDQTATQTTIDDLYSQMLEKCGVPSSSRDARSTSDNVGAVYLRSGWAAADTACRCTEDYYRISNRYFDAIVLKILRMKGLLDLSPDDFKLVFLRNHMDNLLVKTQAAMNMKSLGLAPEIWLERSGLSNDPVSDIEKSKDTIYIQVDENGEMQALAENPESTTPEQRDNRTRRSGTEEAEAPESESQGANYVSGYYRDGVWIEGYNRD